MLGRVSGRAAEVFFFMVLALPWWALQAYDAYLGPTAAGSSWRRTFRTAWQRGHDIRFLGVLLLISALNDTIIILKNFDYLLPFYCTKFSGIPGFLTKAISPVLHLVVGYGFLRCTRWAFFIYLVYAAYGFTNGMVNLACFGPGRIRNTLLAAVVLSTMYILWRRDVLLKPIISHNHLRSQISLSHMDYLMLLPSLLAFLFPSSVEGVKEYALRFATTDRRGGLRYGEPGRKAGTDRRTTVGTTVPERIPEGRTGTCGPVRKFRPAKRSRIAPGGPGAKRKGIPPNPTLTPNFRLCYL